MRCILKCAKGIEKAGDTHGHTHGHAYTREKKRLKFNPKAIEKLYVQTARLPWRAFISPHSITLIHPYGYAFRTTEHMTP